MATYNHKNYIFTDQLVVWYYMDAFIYLLDSNIRANKIVFEVMKRKIEKYEEKMEEINSISYFWSYLRKETKGFVPELPKTEMVKPIDIPLELLPFLNGQQIFSSSVVLCETYIETAFSHFQEYSRLRENFKNTKGLCELFRSPFLQSSPTAYFARRLEIFSSCINGITDDLDYVVTPIRLAASWSLAQYLKYTSRFFPAFKREVTNIMDQFFIVLDAFIMQHSTKGTLQVFPLASAIEKDDIRFVEVLVRAVPCQDKNFNDYHCIAMRLANRGYGSDRDRSLLVYVTESSMADTERITKIIASVIEDLI